VIFLPGIPLGLDLYSKNPRYPRLPDLPGFGLQPAKIVVVDRTR
jgi:hypothetical protein